MMNGNTLGDYFDELYLPFGEMMHKQLTEKHTPGWPPANLYKDAAHSIPHEYPLILDEDGRFAEPIYGPDGEYEFQLLDMFRKWQCSCYFTIKNNGDQNTISDEYISDTISSLEYDLKYNLNTTPYNKVLKQRKKLERFKAMRDARANVMLEIGA